MVTKRLPGVDKDRHAPTSADRAGLPPGAQTQSDDCGSGWVGGDHPYPPRGGTAVPAEAGFDVNLIWVLSIVGRGVIFTLPSFLSQCGRSH